MFLLTGIATLLNVFSTRLARVADRVETANKALDGANADERRVLSAQLAHLHGNPSRSTWRLFSPVWAEQRPAPRFCFSSARCATLTVTSVLFGLFGLAVVCAPGAIAAYTVEMMIAGTGIRPEVAQSRREAAEDEAVEGEAHPVGGEGQGGGEGGAGS